MKMPELLALKVYPFTQRCRSQRYNSATRSPIQKFTVHEDQAIVLTLAGVCLGIPLCSNISKVFDMEKALPDQLFYTSTGLVTILSSCKILDLS